MPGTRTAPDVTAAANQKLISFKWMDVSGDIRTDTLPVPAAATNAQIEAMAVALQAGSNASLYAVEVTQSWASVADAQNAIGGNKSQSVHDQLFFLAKNVDPFMIALRTYFPAPIGTLFIADSDSLDPQSPEIIALLTAFVAVIGNTYSIVHGRYTERSEINEKTPI